MIFNQRFHPNPTRKRGTTAVRPRQTSLAYASGYDFSTCILPHPNPTRERGTPAARPTQTSLANASGYDFSGKTQDSNSQAARRETTSFYPIVFSSHRIFFLAESMQPIRHMILFSVAILWMSVTYSLAQAQLPGGLAEPGPYGVDSLLGEWTDADRNARVVKWKAYLPKSDTPMPIVIFSHGGGGSREGNSMLGEHLASHGFVAFHLQHQGSDIEAVRANRKTARTMIEDPKLSAPRFRDIGFVVSQFTKASVEGPLKRRIDPQSVGISGHSFGALTTQVIAGQRLPGIGQDLALPTLKGAFVLSPSPPRPAYGDETNVFNAMKMPLFFLTGTADDGPDEGFKTEARRVPFDRSKGVDRWLIVLNDANHYTFAGLERVPRLIKFKTGVKDDPNVTINHALIRVAAVSFWKWTLLNDKTSRNYLASGEFQTQVGKHGTFEYKAAAP
jgi:dienelactone hydrolase